MRGFGCDGKVRFATWTEADRVASRKGKKDRRRAAYRCPVCRGFHLRGLRPKPIRLD